MNRLQLCFCEDHLSFYRKSVVQLFGFLEKVSVSRKKEALFRVSRPKLLTLTPYPKVSYTYKYTYIDKYIYIYIKKKLPNSDLRYLFFFCFVALCYLVYMYYKVYIKITESEKKRLLFILAKVKNSAFDIYKGVKCVHLKKKKKCITVVFECFVFHSIYFTFFFILTTLFSWGGFVCFCWFFF